MIPYFCRNCMNNWLTLRQDALLPYRKRTLLDDIVRYLPPFFGL